MIEESFEFTLLIVRRLRTFLLVCKDTNLNDSVIIGEFPSFDHAVKELMDRYSKLNNFTTFVLTKVSALNGIGNSKITSASWRCSKPMLDFIEERPSE